MHASHLESYPSVADTLRTDTLSVTGAFGTVVSTPATGKNVQEIIARKEYWKLIYNYN